MRRLWIRWMPLVAVCALALGAVAGDARAALPWWHINTISSPASQPGKESLVTLEVSNLGDAAVDGVHSPVKIVDTLPAGVVVHSAQGSGGGSFPIGINSAEQLNHCNVAGQTVTCSYAGPLLAYERLLVLISVGVEPGAGTGVSEVAVSGGGAPPLAAQDRLALGESPPAFGVEHYEMTAEQEGGAPETQAGAHPFQLTTTFTLNTKAAPITQNGRTFQEVQPVALPKDLRFNLPPGLVGNPTAIPKCGLSVFLNSGLARCPNDTVVGVATAVFSEEEARPVDAPQALTSALYNLQPAVGEPARFGFDTSVGPVVLDTSVRTGGDYGVVVTVPNIIDSLGVIGSQVTFWGAPGDSRHDTVRGTCLDQYEGSFPNLTSLEEACPLQEQLRPFLIMPTSCETPPVTSVEGDPWSSPGAYTAPFSYTFGNPLGEPFAEDGCNRLTFEPAIGLTPDGTQAAAPTGLSVDVHVDQQASLNPSGLAEAEVKDTTVALPAGVVLDPSGADGLQACTLAQIGLDSPSEQTCPEASKVGTLEIHTPLLPDPLVGAAYLATQQANPFGSLIALYLVARDPVSGVLVKIAGKVSACEQAGEILEGVTCQAPGQLISTFNDTPQLPFEDLTLHFFGGSRAPLATPSACGSYTTSAAITPWSGEPAAQLVSLPFSISSGPAGTACLPMPAPFTPSLTSGSTNLQAGAFTPFTMTMSREDGQQTLQAITLHMPPGLSGDLTGVEQCPEPQASQGTCGPGSLIGETTVSVGVGGTPFTVKGGRVYLTGPYRGAPFGLSIVNPAKAGPFDLESTPARHPACDCLLVRAKIEVDPLTAALTITSDNEGPYKIPTILEGIPLQIKHVNVTINRPGFTFNPTSCEPLQISASIASSEGASAAQSIPLQVTNCASLRFAPHFSASTRGNGRFNGDGASLSVDLHSGQGPSGDVHAPAETNIRKVEVQVPKQLPARLATLQKSCPEEQFAAGPAGCPATSVVGNVVAHTPILPVPLSGPAYLVSHGGAAFPDLVLVLQGDGVTIVLTGHTQIKKGITYSRFETLPDAPVSSFELNLPEGQYSVLAGLGLCHVTKTKVVTKIVTVHRRGHTRKVKRRVKERVAAPLVMPTAITAQDGAVFKQQAKIAVVGCPRPKPHHGGKRRH